MIIETKRLLLKPYSMEDLEDYYSLMSNPIVWTYSTNTPHENILQSEQQLKEILTRYEHSCIGFYALFEKTENVYIGEAGILSINRIADRCVIGYNLLPDYWGKGYATEIAKSLIEYAFDELQVERVEALAHKSNMASCKVLEKSGMYLDGLLRHFAKIRGNYEDVCYYSIISSDR